MIEGTACPCSSTGLGGVVSTTIGVAGGVISGVATTFIAFVFGLLTC